MQNKRIVIADSYRCKIKRQGVRCKVRGASKEMKYQIIKRRQATFSKKLQKVACLLFIDSLLFFGGGNGLGLGRLGGR